MTTILIADDHPLFRDALKFALQDLDGATTLIERDSFDAAIEALSATNEIDLALVDLKMPGMQGMNGLVYLRGQFPALPLVVISGNDDPGVIRRAMALGCAGYIVKTLSNAEIRAAVAQVLAGETVVPPGLDRGGESDEQHMLRERFATLTPQQMRVLMMVAEGLLNKQIAYQLGVSEATIKAHVSAILTKLKVDSRTQAVILAAKLGESSGSGAGG
jgi:DNA-binding NarL/FixJ family response regulator